MKTATAASGNVMRKTEPHQKLRRSAPATSGPSDAIAPPLPDQTAIDLVRAGPDQSAVIERESCGVSHSCGDTPEQTGGEQDLVAGGVRSEQAGRIASDTPNSNSILRP